MLIYVNPTTGALSRIDEKEKDRTLEICERLDEELRDWLKYHKMAEGGDGRYNVISAQEFQHALVALSDLLDSMKGRLTPEELEQFQKFRTECLAK